MNNIGEDQNLNIENLKCCGNCLHSYMEGESVCCSAEYVTHNPENMWSRCEKDWKFDLKNYISRIKGEI